MGKYKLTPQEYKEIKAAAVELPPISRTNADGSPMVRKITKYQGATEYQKGVGYKKNSLHGTEPVLLNHEVEMVRHFNNGGPAAVKHYVLMIHAINNKGKNVQVKHEESN